MCGGRGGGGRGGCGGGLEVLGFREAADTAGRASNQWRAVCLARAAAGCCGRSRAGFAAGIAARAAGVAGCSGCGHDGAEKERESEKGAVKEREK